MIEYKGGDIVKLYKGQVAKLELVKFNAKSGKWFIPCRIGCKLIILTDIKEILHKIKDAGEA